MRLSISPTSPFARKVRIVALETGLMDSIELVSANPWDENTDVPDVNPLGKIPALVLEGSEVLVDSKQIARYLISLASNNQMLLPSSKLTEQLQLEAIGDGISEAAANRFLELNRRPPEKQMDYWLDRYQGAINRSLAWLEQHCDQLASGFTLGSIAVASALGYLDLRYEKLNWRESYPRLAEWYATIVDRKSMQTTAPPTS